MADVYALNKRLAQATHGTTWGPRLTREQLRAIETAIGASPPAIDPEHLRGYAGSGDWEHLTEEEQVIINHLTRQAQEIAVNTPDIRLNAADIRRLSPHKVAVVLESLS